MRSGWEASTPGSAPSSALGWRPGEAWLRRLSELLASATARPAAPDWHDLPDIVSELRPAGIRAVIGYGSWYLDGLRKPTSFPDVYVVVDDYLTFGERPFHAWMNRVLPPNVYFVWREGEDHARVRGKYNVISSADLERECGARQRDVYTAGRLTKLVWIARARDAATRGWLVERLVDAHCALTPVALALLPDRFAADDFSHQLLSLSYRGEPRLEGWERVRALHAAHEERYREIHGLLLAAFVESTQLLETTPDGFRKRSDAGSDAGWGPLRRGARRLLRRSRWRGYLRWPRIVLTEPKLVDLAANEAERKAGVRIRVTPRLRRHPFLYGLPEFLRVLRERNTRERIR